MSDEPRLRLEDSGTVVSEYWYDQSTGETVVESESGETYRFANDGTLDTPALNTDDALFKGKPWHDVTAYGAVGDGETDDYPAIQEAVKASRDPGELGVVYFPEPEDAYLVNDKITWGNDQLFLSPRPWDGATIRAGADLDTAIFGNGAQFKNVQLWGLEIDGTGGWTNHPYSPGHKAIASNPGSTDDDTRGLSIEYCYAHDTRATGIGCDSIPQLEIRHNIVENCGTDGQSTGSNGIGTGIGEMSGYCPMWMENNIVLNTAEFGIILEQTADTIRSHGQYINNNYVADAKVGIGCELTNGASVDNNVIETSTRMDHGILLDSLDSTFGPERVTANGNKIVTPSGSSPSADVAAFEMGTDATWCIGSDTIIDLGHAGTDLANNGSFCAQGGLGVEAAGFGAEPTAAARWEQINVPAVRNSDDGAEWSLDTERNWKQVAPADAVDLSGNTASVAGFLAYDDGTNTTGSGALCQWDSTNSQWIPFDGSATFA